MAKPQMRETGTLFTMRITRGDLQLLHKAAQRSGLSMSQLVRARLVDILGEPAEPRGRQR
jgi:uncharacterized protein (DUF1778 family)